MKEITLIENNWEVWVKVGNFSEEVNSVVLEVSDKCFAIIMLKPIGDSRIVMNFLYDKFKTLKKD